MTDQRDTDRRNYTRIPLDREAQVETQGGQHSCVLLDVSLKGALVACDDDWQPHLGDELDLAFSLDGQRPPQIRMEGEIVHLENGRAGIHCLHISLESLQLLRELIEINIDNPDALKRELETLIAEYGLE